MGLTKYVIRSIVSIERIPYEEGMLNHFLEIKLHVEHCGKSEKQLWCFGKDDWQDIKKKGYFFA